MSAPLDAIVDLQITLSQLADADRRLNTIPDWMRELHEEHSRRQAEIDTVEAAKGAAEKGHREAEAELSDAQEKLKRYQEQISRVSTQREYGALLKEIDTVKEQVRGAEQRAFEALERSEQAKQRLTELNDGFQELDERYQAELAKWESEKPGVRETLDELASRSEELRAKVPRNVQVLFDRIYDRYAGQALARVCQTVVSRGGNAMWHCEACSYNVRPQIVVDIRNKHALHQCDSCKRILFLQEGE